MIDYIVRYNKWISDIITSSDTVITIEEDMDVKDSFERGEIIRDILLEKLKEEYGEGVELIDYESLVNCDYDIYKLTY